MPSIDITDLAQKMAEAAFEKIKEKAPDARGYVSTEMEKIAHSLAFIEGEVLAGRMTQEKAVFHFDIQKNAAITVMLTFEGLGRVAAQQAINAALSVVRDTVNGAVGFTLL